MAAPVDHPRYWRSSPELANKTRRDAILYIENIPSSQELLQLRGSLGNANSWSTGIQCIYYRQPQVFRNAPQIESADDLVQWGEFVIPFVEASLSCALPQLLRFPPNQIGLNRFLFGRGRGTEALYNNRVRLTRMFHGLSGGGVHPSP